MNIKVLSQNTSRLNILEILENEFNNTSLNLKFFFGTFALV